jgi:hypothetical protein
VSAAQWDAALDDAEWVPDASEAVRWPGIDTWTEEAAAAYLNGLELPRETEQLRAYLERLVPVVKREFAFLCAWTACTGEPMPDDPTWPDWISRQTPRQIARKVSVYGRSLQPVGRIAGADIARERSGDRRHRARERVLGRETEAVPRSTGSLNPRY